MDCQRAGAIFCGSPAECRNIRERITRATKDTPVHILHDGDRHYVSVLPMYDQSICPTQELAQLIDAAMQQLSSKIPLLMSELPEVQDAKLRKLILIIFEVMSEV